MFRSSFLLTGMLLGLLTGCGPAFKPSAPQRAQLAIVIDASSSAALAKGQTIADVRCPEAIGAVEQALTAPGLRQLDVLVVATGGHSTAYESRSLIPWRTFMPTSRLFGPRLSINAQRLRFIHELNESCRSKLTVENSSPILYAIERALLSLSNYAQEISQSGQVAATRSLVVVSDLRETVHVGIRSRLSTVSEALRHGRPAPPPSPSVPLLKLNGIQVRVCGLAEYTSSGTTDKLMVSPAALSAVWSEVLAGASFDAACRIGNQPSEATSTGGAL